MQIAVVIVHNKTDAENQAQIDLVKSLIDEVREPLFTFDDSGNQIPLLDEETGTQLTSLTGYKVKGLSIDHLIRFYQIIPFGVTPPPNLYELDSHKVFYGAGDEDKTGNHPRFFNWGLKRGTDYGADICIYLDNLPQFTATKARQALQKFTNDTEFVEATFGKLASLRLLKEVGLLKEDRNLTEAISDLKTRTTGKGLKVG